jgi:hypothetical protein
MYKIKSISKDQNEIVMTPDESIKELKFIAVIHENGANVCDLCDCRKDGPCDKIPCDMNERKDKKGVYFKLKE